MSRSPSKSSTPFLRPAKTPIAKTPNCRQVALKSSATPINGRRLVTPVTALDGKFRRVSESPVANRYARASGTLCTSSPLPSTNTSRIITTPDLFNQSVLGTPQSARKINQVLSEEEGDRVVVAIRVRPILRKETNEKIKKVIEVDGKQIKVADKIHDDIVFKYDICLDSSDVGALNYADQQFVYSATGQQLLDKAFEGYNTSLFAYGQTGSGKSYSIMGMPSVDENLESASRGEGTIPRLCRELFQRVNALKEDGESPCRSRVEVEISYYEIYKEKIHDLLTINEAHKNVLKVREHPDTGPYVVDLSTHAVESYDDLQGWILLGNQQRATAATSVNDRSSRSHAVFCINLKQITEDVIEDVTHRLIQESKINVIDLAGSERVAQSKAVGDRREEGVKINKSLLTLGRVIIALADKSRGKKVVVPYRDSVLTWLLKDSLGGNSKTVMLATISPCSNHIEETLATLRYACQARDIVNRARINEDPRNAVIRELRAQLEELRNQLSESMGTPRKTGQSDQSDQLTSLRTQVEDLKCHLKEQELKQAEAFSQWKERLKTAERQKSIEQKNQENTGLLDRLTPTKPCLVNLNEDPLLSGTLLYYLKEGKNIIGRDIATSDIRLLGCMIAKHHCSIGNERKMLIINPGDENGECFVNGEVVTSSLELFHGDRIVFGGSHFFRVYNPAKGRVGTPAKNIVDFQFAYEELKKAQDERLGHALQKTREETRRELEEELRELRDEVETEMTIQKQSYEDRIKELLEMLDEKSQTGDSDKLKIITETVADLKAPDGEFGSDFLKELDEICSDVATTLDASVSNGKSVVSQGFSIFELNMMIKEANSLSKELKSGLEFIQEISLVGGSVSYGVKIVNTELGVCTSWSVGKLKSSLEYMRDAAQGEQKLDQLFDPGENWQSADGLKRTKVGTIPATLTLPEMNKKLATLREKHGSSLSILSETAFGIAKSRLKDLQASRTSSIFSAQAATGSPNPQSQKLVQTSEVLHSVFSSFVVSSEPLDLIQHTQKLYELFTLYRDVSVTDLEKMASSASYLMMNLRPFLYSLQGAALVGSSVVTSHLMQKVVELLKGLQLAVSFILQGIAKRSDNLVREWATKGIETLNRILAVIGEALTFMEIVKTPYEILDQSSAELCLSTETKGNIIGQFVGGIAGAYVTAYRFLSASVEETVDRLTSMAISRTLPCSSFLTPLRLGNRSEEAEMLKSCHDCIALTDGLLKRGLPGAEPKIHHDWVSVGEVEDIWREKTMSLGCIAQSLTHLSQEAETASQDPNHDTRILRMYVGELELLISKFSQQFLSPDVEDGELNDIRHAINSVRKLAGERTLRQSVRKGKDGSDYAPIPARFFASPGLRRLRDEEGSCVKVPPPTKSSFKDPAARKKDLNVQFDMDEIETLEGNVALKRLRFEDD